MNRASAQNRYKYLLCSVAFVFLLLLFFAFAIEGEPTSELNKRGLNLMKEGKPLEARKLHEEALLIQERELGPSHFDVATTLENLAETYRNPVENSEPTSDHAKARQLYKRALKIREALLGLNDVSLCKLLHHIGDTYNKSALHEQAHPFHDRALGISELTYGRAFQYNPLAQSPRRYVSKCGRSDQSLGTFWTRACHSGKKLGT